MQLITTRNKEISFAELKKAISSGNGLELIRPGDKFAIELKNGELVNAVCGGYVNEKRARFVLEDCLADKWRMNDTPTNKGGYLKSEGRRHVLEDILPLFPDELAEAFEPRFMSEEIDGERHEYADTLWIPSATDVFGAGDWWNEEPDSVQLEIFKRERDRVKEHVGDGTWLIGGSVPRMRATPTLSWLWAPAAQSPTTARTFPSASRPALICKINGSIIPRRSTPGIEPITRRNENV